MLWLIFILKKSKVIELPPRRRELRNVDVARGVQFRSSPLALTWSNSFKEGAGRQRIGVLLHSPAGKTLVPEP